MTLFRFESGLFNFLRSNFYLMEFWLKVQLGIVGGFPDSIKLFLSAGYGCITWFTDFLQGAIVNYSPKLFFVWRRMWERRRGTYWSLCYHFSVVQWHFISSRGALLQIAVIWACEEDFAYLWLWSDISLGWQSRRKVVSGCTAEFQFQRLDFRILWVTSPDNGLGGAGVRKLINDKVSGRVFLLFQ